MIDVSRHCGDNKIVYRKMVVVYLQRCGLLLANQSIASPHLLSDATMGDQVIAERLPTIGGFDKSRAELLVDILYGRFRLV